MLRRGYPVEEKKIQNLLKSKGGKRRKIREVGPKYTVWLQGQEVMYYESGSAKKEGPVGIQLYGNRSMKIDFRNLSINEI